MNESPGAPVSREALAAAVWPADYFNINISNLDKHIRNLRPKLGKGLEIRSFYGTGYGIFKK